MSGPQPAPPGAAGGRKPWSPVTVVLIGVGLVVAAFVAIYVSGAGATLMSDGTDPTAADADLQELTEGVKYRDLKAGEGEECPEGAKVKIHYTGWLKDGTVFDSSRDRGKAAEFELAKLIPGWQEGIPGMKKGGVRKLVIAPAKGYGARGGGKVPANATLIFEVEMIAFSGGEKAGRPGPEKLSDGTAPGADDPGLKDIGGGLKVRDLKEGAGAACPPGATVSANYTGWLTNGTVFDSSIPQGAPIEFSLARVVEGWQKGIPGMKVGGVRKLVIPAAQGYGGQRQGIIPPNSTLVFEVELAAIK